ncbi:beta-galactosidase [Jatropha curcas]|uniref:beta-galactosidase n=1 Tax=Jatropha curcas TaxID=180498 RepID=UPI001895BBF3|nr:beta-galactosidase [Jatropha curcas]
MWNTAISSLVNQWLYEKALRLFRHLHLTTGFRADQCTLLAVLAACAGCHAAMGGLPYKILELTENMELPKAYHGGTNFGETGGGPYITTSYDYDAPIDEYGNLNQPKWGHLKNLHEALYSMKDHIVYGDKTDIDCGQNKWATIFSYQGKRSCFFSNIDYNDQTLTFEGADLFLPGWSVSLSPDCFHEVYNTAKVNAQTSVMVNRPIHPVDEDDTPYKLEWQSTPEQIVHINRNGNLDSGAFVASNAVLDQKTVTNGTSDYLYLLTLYFHNSSDPQWVNKDIFLQVRTNGPIIHAFVNKRFVGSQYSDYHGHLDDYGFQFEREIRLVNGANRIVLASVSVGLPNYGPNFDYWGCGIVGPIQLIARSRNGSEPEVIKDISTNRWIHKTGLHGVDLEYHKLLHRYSPSWSAIPQIDRPFTWYKTNFLYPHGTDPVVVDLNGMGKGVAWINGINIGRYWPKNVASEEGCSIFCDYKNKYDSGKCSTGCGQPTQRYYHIPRDWLRPDNNLLVLFEEFGGNPQNVQIQTVTVGKVCANAYEWNKLELACAGGHNITKINFASFGNPQGKCGDYSPGRCHAIDSLDVVQKACLNQRNCTIDVNINSFALLPPECRQIFSYRLAVEAFC